jgi:hypothetical protein
VGGIVALAHFGSNRYLIMEPESGNRYLSDGIEYRFSLFAFSRIIPMIWIHR